MDRAKALAWRQREREKCPAGHHPDVSDPEHGGDPEALELGSRLCRLCEIAQRHATRYEKDREPGEYQVWKAVEPEPAAG